MDTETVFVITPIGGTDSTERRRADDLLDLVIRPTLGTINAEREVSLEAIRADKIERPGSITGAIVDHILKSKVVIVDLAGLNPNVLYEMGIADSFGIPTVRLSDHPGRLPFDAKDHNAIGLVSTADGSLLGRDVETCKKLLRAQVEHALAPDFTPTSIVVRHAKIAQLDSLTNALDAGSEQEAAMAAVLEKLAVIEGRFDHTITLDSGFEPTSLLPGLSHHELRGLSSTALGLLFLLTGVMSTETPPITRDVWERAVMSGKVPSLPQDLRSLMRAGLVQWVLSSDDEPALGLAYPSMVVSRAVIVEGRAGPEAADVLTDVLRNAASS